MSIRRIIRRFIVDEYEGTSRNEALRMLDGHLSRGHNPELKTIKCAYCKKQCVVVRFSNREGQTVDTWGYMELLGYNHLPTPFEYCGNCIVDQTTGVMVIDAPGYLKRVSQTLFLVPGTVKYTSPTKKGVPGEWWCKVGDITDEIIELNKAGANIYVSSGCRIFVGISPPGEHRPGSS